MGGEFNYPPRDEVMSLQVMCGEPSVDERIRKVVCSGSQRGYSEVPGFCPPALYSIYDYVCGVVRQCKALSFLGQVVPTVSSGAFA